MERDAKVGGQGKMKTKRVTSEEREKKYGREDRNEDRGERDTHTRQKKTAKRSKKKKQSNGNRRCNIDSGGGGCSVVITTAIEAILDAMAMTNHTHFVDTESTCNSFIDNNWGVVQNIAVAMV